MRERAPDAPSHLCGLAEKLWSEAAAVAFHNPTFCLAESIAAMSETVQSYIEKHNLQKRVEDVLNSTVKSKPEEPMSYMVRGDRGCEGLRAGEACVRRPGRVNLHDRESGRSSAPALHGTATR